MITDARTVTEGNTFESDICIVGAGPAGITIAREFLSQNLRVSLIESGGTDFDAGTQALADGATVGDPYQNPAESRIRRYGGTAHQWVTLSKEGPGGRYVPMDAIDFEERACIPYSGWPFDRTHLEPYYERAQTVCGLGPCRYEAEGWADGSNPLLPLSGNRIHSGAFHTGVASLFTQVYADELAKAANIHVFLHANALEVRTEDNGERISEVRVASLGGARFSVRSKQFVLAAGGIENARLLLLSNKQQPRGLGNGHDLVGRFFMEHPKLFSCDLVPFDRGLFDRMGFYDVHSANGVMVAGRLALTEDVMRREDLPNVSAILFPMLRGERSAAHAAVRKLRKQFPGNALSSETLRLFGTAVRGVGDLARCSYRRIMHHDRIVLDGWSQATQKQKLYGSFEVVLHLEQSPDPENRVTLGTTLDALGQRKVEVHWRWSTRDNDNALRARAIFAEEMERNGIGRLVLHESALQGSVHHHMGTTRMHRDPHKGVVNENSRVHGLSNLFVAGSSVFPTGGYANPTLTLVALSLRLADHLRQNAGS